MVSAGVRIIAGVGAACHPLAVCPSAVTSARGALGSRD
jgi:hypothetical protein